MTMLAACPSHLSIPPVDTPVKAAVAARRIVRTPVIIPEFMWATSYPESTACCTRGALAMSLTHAAIRRLLS